MLLKQLNFNPNKPCLFIQRPLHDVTSEAKTRQKMTKKRSLYVINEHFESFFHAVFASVVVVRRSHPVTFLTKARLTILTFIFKGNRLRFVPTIPLVKRVFLE